MTEEQKSQQLEHNVGRLFERLAEEGNMSPVTHAAILDRLREAASLSRPEHRTGSVGHRWLRWASLAAGLVLALAFLLWPTSGNVTWAAVARHISQARTLVALTTTERLDGQEARVVFRSRLYYKDPGMSRTELYEGARQGLAGNPDRVEVLVRQPGTATELRLYPAEHRGERKVYEFADSAASRVTLDLVAEAWTRLSQAAQSTARPIGQRTIGRVPAVGFEVPAEVLFGEAPQGKTHPTLQVWAARGTGMPVALVLESETERTTVDQMRWNEPLAGDLFDVGGPQGWTVHERRIDVPAAGRPAEARFVGFAVHLLSGAPGAAGGQGGSDGTARLLPERYLSNADVESAASVPDGSQCGVSIQMTPEGTEKLARLTRNHVGEQLAIVIDGKVAMAPVIRNEMTDGRVKVTGRFTAAECVELARALQGE